MNGPVPKQVMHGASPLQTSRYTEERIAQFNAEHDRKYGFSEKHQTFYTNMDRHPETYRGKRSEIWNKP